MNIWEMIVLIVGICVIGAVKRARYQAEGRQNEGGQGDDAVATETARLREELVQLKRRVATLERIVTDGSSALDREIEALRDR